MRSRRGSNQPGEEGEEKKNKHDTEFEKSSSNFITSSSNNKKNSSDNVTEVATVTIAVTVHIKSNSNYVQDNLVTLYPSVPVVHSQCESR